MSLLRFAYPSVFYIFGPILILLIIYRLKFHKSPFYVFPLTGILKKAKKQKSQHHKTVLFVLRSLLLVTLIFFMARPQWTDSQTHVNVDGVDIILTLDVSGSMQLFDDLQDQRQRIDVAKEEALRFIEKRVDDQIGIVIFAADSICNAPLTLDKSILKSIVNETKLGIINQIGTSLGTGLATSINKLRHSKAKSKIIILLTDGCPTPHTEKVSVDTALILAKQRNIKIYTVGIGNENGGYVKSAFGRIHREPDNVDERLLQKIATETGGKFFRANNPKDMKFIYETINELEKTSYKTNIFSRYHEAFSSFLWLLLLLLLGELFLKLFVWRGLA